MDRVTLVSSLQKGDKKTFCQQTHLNAVIQQAKDYSESYEVSCTEQGFGIIQFTGLPSELNLSQCPHPKQDTYIIGEYGGLTTLVGVFRSGGAFDRCCVQDTSSFCTITCIDSFDKCYRTEIKNCPSICSYCEDITTKCDIDKSSCAIIHNCYCDYIWNYGLLKGYICNPHGGTDPQIEIRAVYCFFQYKVHNGVQRTDLSGAPISIYQKYLI